MRAQAEMSNATVCAAFDVLHSAAHRCAKRGKTGFVKSSQPLSDRLHRGALRRRSPAPPTAAPTSAVHGAPWQPALCLNAPGRARALWGSRRRVTAHPKGLQKTHKRNHGQTSRRQRERAVPAASRSAGRRRDAGGDRRLYCGEQPQHGAATSPNAAEPRAADADGF